MQDREEEDAGRGDRGGDVAEDVDLRPPRPLGLVFEAQRHAAGLQRGPHRPPHVDRAGPCGGRAAPVRASPAAASSARRRGGPRPGPGSGWSAGRGPARPAGGRGAGSRCARSGRVRARVAGGARTRSAARGRSAARSSPSSPGGWVPAVSPRVRRIRCTSTPTTPEPSPRPKAAIASRARSRIRSSSPAIIASRICSRSSSMSSLSPCPPSPSPGALAALGDAALDRLGLGGAEEVAVEEQLEDAAVVLGLGDRRRQRLAEVVLRGPLDVLEGGEGVEDLRGADRDPLAAQLLAEAEQLRRHPGRARVGLRPVGRGGAHRLDNRRVRARGTGRGGCAPCARCGAARRRRFVAQIDVMEVVYRVYVAAIFGAIALSARRRCRQRRPRPSAAASTDLGRDGPALLGLGVALAVLAGLRSGARGGPLAIEDAEVQYVLLAPIDRGVALRSSALRQLRIAVLGGAVLGAVAGNFAFRRLPGSPVEWIACLAAVRRRRRRSACSAPRCSPRAGACGRRRPPRPASLLLAWSRRRRPARRQRPRRRRCSALLATLPLQSGTPAGLAGARGRARARDRAARPALARRPLARGGPPPRHPDRPAALLRLGAGSPRRRPAAPPARLREAAAATLAPAAVPRPCPGGRSGGAAGRASCAGRRRAGAGSLLLGRRRGRSRVGAWSGTTPLLALAGLACSSSPRSTWSSRSRRRSTTRCGATCSRSRPLLLIRRHLVAPVAAMALVLVAAPLIAAALGSAATGAPRSAP